ncbi:fasciclin domain-containing protein [Ginsengibacter hankyongi]|uniref:Fasciclin domain-containing protein n=1 Tax=Ginsengibacter hankyongi TaxID=2607284 RepID=A0A5J5ID55_9BACT|nr:fasciclin domain-containing protein [Ginsengibacter hankyongi]KAA9036343.1 fasciclin domain-containing protein [Ginsengibacter hankyongi]
MKKNIFQNSQIIKVSLLTTLVAFVISCNKDLPQATPIIYPPANNSSTSIGTAISTDTSYSFFKAAVTKAGLMAALSDSTSLFTVFLPNNNAFRVSGIPSIGVVNSLPLAKLVPLIQYHIIPGQQYASASVPTSFPNIQLPSYLTIGTLPGTPLALKMSVFLSARTNGFWDNNIPVVVPDLKFNNGIVHLVAALVSPPAQVLKAAIYNNPNLTYFKAAIVRADSGQSGLHKLDSLLGYAVTNMTVLAPSDAAFQTLIFGLAFQSYLDQVSKIHPPTGSDTANAVATANGAVAAGPAFLSTNNVTTAEVAGIMAYHFLATDQGAGFQPNIRAFSVNFSSTPSFYTTLVNTVVSVHPGVMAKATFAGPFVTNLQFTGLGTFPPGGAPYTGAAATATSLDNHCVNGVFYIIDKVLLPQ